MEKFHYFLYGKEFTLETDQKPLVSIYKKHMVDISPGVQRLIVNYLNRYSALSTHLAAPLSALTHQATDYKPGKVHQENFN